MVESKLVTLYSDVKAVPIRWIWYPYIPIGKITILQGDPGDGKSTMMMELITELSKGGATPDGKALGRPQRVLYQCSEDGSGDTIKNRLEASGADCRNIGFINETVHDGITLDDERIRGAIVEFRPQMVVIDPIQSYIGNDSDLQITVRARKLMRRLAMWASTYDCAFVLIGHLSKKEHSKDLYRGLGSIDVIASARSVLQVERNEADEDIRIVKQIKSNLAPKGEDLMFEIRSGTGFRWLNAQQASQKVEPKPENPELPKNKHELTAILLKKMLADGPVESTEVKRQLSQYRIGEKTMNEVKKDMGIKPYRKMRRWYWVLPGDGQSLDSTKTSSMKKKHKKGDTGNE